MLCYVYQIFKSFRNTFSRRTTWLVFCMVILAFIGSSEMTGVTSFCRFWTFDARGYHTLLHFFRSSAWSLNTLVFSWSAFVLSQNVTILTQGRVIILGDHTYVPKDGRKMPGVVTLHQHSETQSKPSYFRGHCWGNIGILIGTMVSPYCLPLAISLHQGLVHIGKDSLLKENKETLGTRIVQMALNFAIAHNQPSFLILDAYFPSAAVFNLACSVCSITLKSPMVILIVRAKKNCVAYFEAEKPKKKRPGRYPKYGDKVKLMEMFDQQHLFVKTTCSIYNKTEEILIASADLLWKPTGTLIRFVFAITSRGPIVLMCSDLSQKPVTALELYCSRVRIETMFDMLKNLIGAFCYRFWTKSLTRHSRKPKKNDTLQRPSQNHLNAIVLAWNAIERFVMLGCIALGILQLIALKFEKTVWTQYSGFLRTRSRTIPSERTVKSVIANSLFVQIRCFATGTIIDEILKRYGKDKSFFQ